MAKSLQLRRTIICLWISVILTNGMIAFLQEELPKKTYGPPQIITEYVSFNHKPIEQIVDDGQYMYVLADNHNGYIQVYTLDGEYQHTLSFYRPSINGTFNMVVDSDMLYVFDMHKNLYVFKQGDFISYIKNTEASQPSIETNFNNASDRYEIRFGSIWRVDQEKPECVVNRSVQGFISQYYINWIIIIIGGALLVSLWRDEDRGRFAPKDRGRLA